MIVSGSLISPSSVYHGRFDLIDIIRHPGDKIALPPFRKIADRQHKYLCIHIISKEGDRRASDRRGDIGRPVIEEVLQNGRDDDEHTNDDQQRGLVIGLGHMRQNFLQPANRIACGSLLPSKRGIILKRISRKGLSIPSEISPNRMERILKNMYKTNLPLIPGTNIEKSPRISSCRLTVDLGGKVSRNIVK